MKKNPEVLELIALIGLILLAVGLSFAMGVTCTKAQDEVKDLAHPVGWQWSEPPENTVIIALWETSPGYYNVYAVLRRDDQYLADTDGPDVVVAREPPTVWAYLP